MKILNISHSNVHLRQQLFWEELSKYAEVLVIAPEEWGNLTAIQRLIKTPDKDFEFLTLKTYNQGNIRNFYFEDNFVEAIIARFEPDVVYLCDELSYNLHRLCIDIKEKRNLNYKLVSFFWENINSPVPEIQALLSKFDLLVCGNSEATKLLDYPDRKKIIMPQVGIDISLFKPKQVTRDIDVLYIGRDAPEKGLGFIKEAYPNVVVKSDLNYEEIPDILNRTKIFVSFPYFNGVWAEQSCGYATLEAMSCGLSVITSDCGAIPEYLGKSQAHILKQKDTIKLAQNISWLLDDNYVRDYESRSNRSFVRKKFSNKVIAKKLVKVFKELL